MLLLILLLLLLLLLLLFFVIICICIFIYIEYNFDTEILNSNGTQECSDGFYRKNGSCLCHPSCYTFKQQSQFLTSAIDVSVISVATIGLVAAITAIIIALLRYKRM